MTPEEFSILLNKWRTGQVTPDETRMFVALANSGQFDQLIEEAMEIDLDTERFQAGATKEGKIKHWQFIQNRISDIPAAKIVHRVHFLRTAWFRVAVAVLLFIGIGTYLWNQSQRSGPVIVQNSVVPVDVMPGSDRAVLTLGDGQKIQLDSSANQLLLEKGITNNNALISYSSKAENNAVNTLATPNGGQYRIRLSDGTMVWLNAASSITYPAVFNGSMREVSITGEAYFEVVKDKSRPFIVKTISDEIEVLGTSFNINSYKDELSVKTSLMEGAVKVNNRILRPGEAYTKSKIIKTNIEQDIAWKNGVFNFSNVAIQDAMRQFARWYDVEVVYDELPVNAKLSGEMDRALTLQEALLGLEGVSAKFRLSGRVVHVLPLK